MGGRGERHTKGGRKGKGKERKESISVSLFPLLITRAGCVKKGTSGKEKERRGKERKMRGSCITSSTLLSVADQCRKEK